MELAVYKTKKKKPEIDEFLYFNLKKCIIVECIK